jgi:hypothetical protein
MKNDRFALVDGHIYLVEFGKRHMLRAGNFLTRVLVLLTDVNQDGAAVEKTPGFGWLDSAKGHVRFPSLVTFARRTKQIVQAGKELLDPRIGDPVPERLTFTAKSDEPLFPHTGEVLGQGRLGQAYRFGQCGDIAFAPLHQFAQDHQPALVREGTKDVGDFGCFLREGLWVKR